mgnify:FL=1
MHRLIVLLLILLLAAPALAAESDKDFAKCQKMLNRWAERHQEKSDKAFARHVRNIDRMVAQHTSTAPDPAAEHERITAIIDRLMARFELDEYRRVLVEESIADIVGVVNDEQFVCPYESSVNLSFKYNLERYETRMEEIEEGVRDRLDLESLRPNEGLVVISFYAHGYAQNVEINRLGAIGGGISFGPVSDGEYFRVLKVKAGTYRWNSIWNRVWNMRSTLYLKRGEMEFTVEPGKLNYTGVFIYRSALHAGRYADVHDRTAIVLTILEQRYPELLEQYDFANGLNPGDRCLDFYLEERPAWQAGADDA